MLILILLLLAETQAHERLCVHMFYFYHLHFQSHNITTTIKKKTIQYFIFINNFFLMKQINKRK